MGEGIGVTAEELAKAQTICTMQAGHLEAIGAFVNTHCGMESTGDIGWMLQPFVGRYKESIEIAQNGFDSARNSADGIATALAGVADDFSTNENEAMAVFQELSGNMGDIAAVSSGSSVDPANVSPSTLGGHGSWIPPWISDAGNTSYSVQESTPRWWAPPPDPNIKPWETSSYDIADSVLNPYERAGAGATWIEGKFRKHVGAKKAGLSLEEYRSTMPGRLEDRFNSNFAKHGSGTSAFTGDNLETMSRGVSAVGGLVDVVSGGFDVADRGREVAQAWQRNSRVQDVAHGGGYGDASLSGMGIPVPNSLQEIEDPRSAISSVPASREGNIGDSLRWKAGLLLGGLDWIITQLLNGRPGPIEYLVKPFAGDWCALDVTAQCWSLAGVATTSVGHNFEGMPQMIEDWQGAARKAFDAKAQEMADAMYDFSDGCYAMGDVTTALIELGKVLAEFIAGILGVIGDWLTRLAIEAAIPVAGWIAGVIDGAASALQLMDKINKGLQGLKKFLDAMKSVIKVINMINKIINVIKVIERICSVTLNIGAASASKAATDGAFNSENAQRAFEPADFTS